MTDNIDYRGNPTSKQAVKGRDGHGRFAVGNKPKTGFHTNPERRSDGTWKKEDTARYKLEQMMMLTEVELLEVDTSSDTPLFERKLAKAMIDGTWQVIRGTMNEVYGRPRESIGILSKTDNPPIITGFVIPTLPDGFTEKDIE